MNKQPLKYVLKITTGLVDQAVQMEHASAKHLKIGSFLLVNICKGGYKLPKNLKQYSTERSAVIEMDRTNKANGWSSTEFVKKVSEAMEIKLEKAPVDLEKQETPEKTLKIV